ncbi:MAG: ATP-dependent Clp protease proteolytic subunit [Bacteroidaceae bacterium]
MEEYILELNGVVDSYGYMRSNIKWRLSQNAGKPVRCKVNSLGGSVNDAITISKLFEEHGNVVVEFVGFCASAVTWMAFGAKRIEMHEDSLWLCHKSSVMVSLYDTMNAEDLEAAIKKLQINKQQAEAVDLIIAKKYFDRCGAKEKTIKNVLDLMSGETWLTAEDCMAWGFVDVVIPGINKVSNEYRCELIENCAAMNIPVPRFPGHSLFAQEDSLAERVFGKIKRFLNPSDKTDSENIINPNTITTMNEQFTSLNALLGVAGFEETSGNIALSAEQMKTINDALNRAAGLKPVIEEAKASLDEISPAVKSITGLKNKILAVCALVNRIPSGVPSTRQPVTDGNAQDFTDSKVDPVNSYFDNEEEIL